jgi:MFS family permease
MLYLPQLMINVLGYSPIGAGAGMLPMMATFAGTSFAAGKLFDRFGAKPLLILGSGCIAVGAGLIAVLADKQTLLALVPGMVILGLGIGLFYPTATTVGVTGVDESRRSLAGAIIYMFQIAGGSVGLGLTTTVFIGASDGATGGDKFIDGIQTAFGMDAVIAVGGFLIAAFLIAGKARAPHLARLLLAGHSPRGHGP